MDCTIYNTLYMDGMNDNYYRVRKYFNQQTTFDIIPGNEKDIPLMAFWKMYVEIHVHIVRY